MTALEERGSHMSSFRSLCSAQLKTILPMDTLNERDSLHLNLGQTNLQSTLKNQECRLQHSMGEAAI